MSEHTHKIDPSAENLCMSPYYWFVSPALYEALPAEWLAHFGDARLVLHPGLPLDAFEIHDGAQKRRFSPRDGQF